MPITNFIASAAACFVMFAGSVLQGQPSEQKPRVLILGDSISIGYTPSVEDLLQDQAVVVRPKGNCQGTNHGVKQIDRWLKVDGGDWDVIHFNFGLHDIKRIDPKTGKASSSPDHPRQADLETYEKQLREIVAKLKATGATLIFATTTPVPEGGVRPHRDIEDPERYNTAAKKIMQENKIAVNDLYGFAASRLAEIQRPVDVHFTKQGSELLGEQVVEAVKKAIK